MHCLITNYYNTAFKKTIIFFININIVINRFRIEFLRLRLCNKCQGDQKSVYYLATIQISAKLSPIAYIYRDIYVFY